MLVNPKYPLPFIFIIFYLYHILIIFCEPLEYVCYVSGLVGCNQVSIFIVWMA